MSLTSGAWAHASAGGNDARSSRPTSVRSGENVASTAAPSLNIGPTSDAEGYAAREAKSKDLENFKGGATTVVIGSSALVIIIVVVLILILI
ncbi:MAG: hypothetical protein H7X95_12455 [Deltaproteobacteria bacterium]|nr:hypothetical protein [Deltaproteobacteria bacterium]